MKIKGFDAIRKKTEQLSKFAKEIDGELANLSFDPNNPESIEVALQQISDAVDEKTKSLERNDWIQNLAEQLKEQARNSVLEKAAAARIGN
jgi:uncharacterized alpha-E superfamily protein